MWEASRPHSQPAPLPSSGLRPSFAVLLLLSAAWLLALLSVNSDSLLFHYLFAACNCIQVPGPAQACGSPREVGGEVWLRVPGISTETVPPPACQGPLIFLSYVVLSKEVRKALKFACSRKPSPDPALTTKSTLTSVRGRGSGKWRGLRELGERQEAQGACSLCIDPTFPPSPHSFLCVAWEEGDLRGGEEDFDVGEMGMELGRTR